MGYGSLQAHPVRQLPTKPHSLELIRQERTHPSDMKLGRSKLFKSAVLARIQFIKHEASIHPPTIHSSDFDKKAVKEMGLKSLFITRGWLTLGIGIALADFQLDGKKPSRMDALKIYKQDGQSGSRVEEYPAGNVVRACGLTHVDLS